MTRKWTDVSRWWNIVVAWIRAGVLAVINLPSFVWAIVTYRPASFDVALSRLRICHECPDLDILTRQCRACGCFVRLKVQFGNESCPLRKWLDDRSGTR
jgi:hypothetical protein